MLEGKEQDLREQVMKEGSATTEALPETVQDNENTLPDTGETSPVQKNHDLGKTTETPQAIASGAIDPSEVREPEQGVQETQEATPKTPTDRQQGKAVNQIPETLPSESVNRETQEKEVTKDKDSNIEIPKAAQAPNAPAGGIENPLAEIEATNAEDAEDKDNAQRHRIPLLDYHAMSMENLVGELQRLVRNEKVQAIKKHVDGIKYEFDQKFQEFIEHKKEEFIANGGNEIDFRYNSVTKRQFNEVFADYREKKNQYHKDLEKNLKENLARRLEIIEELKGLMTVEEDMNTTYKTFKGLQERWRNAGAVPRTHYNNVWRTYHHHLEIFYDFLHLNRELRDLDFKHNLEEKQKIAERAEALLQEPDLGKAFQELQTLHKVWKEDIGPVDKTHREAIWERFSNATKGLHQRRQEHFKELDSQYEKNLERKQEIIASITAIAQDVAGNHKALQQQIQKIEALRESFFKAGKVPQRVNEDTWKSFKEAVRQFNRNKNAYYKSLKKEQHDNLEKKRNLLELALALKDSEDWDMATQEMKRIQSEWKHIGHVPRKYSDALWKDFKSACNHYFDRLHALKNKSHKEEMENLAQKEALMDRLKGFSPGDDREADMAQIKTFIQEWKSYGRVPYNKKNINQKFNKILDAVLRKMKVDQRQAELLKYGNKIQQLSKEQDGRAIANERSFIRKKIEESKNEIRQLENNLQFFSHASEDNPMVREVVKKVEGHKEALATWMAKLKRLNIMENNLQKEASQGDAENSEEE
ncbi:MAG: DUF349 domain-containing protein [Bacteroidota bacterium]